MQLLGTAARRSRWLDDELSALAQLINLRGLETLPLRNAAAA